MFFSRTLHGCAALCVTVTLGLLAGTARAEEDCSTWLPDFDSQCDRKARFDDFVQPMSMPYLFEDPFITTGANLVGIWHGTADNGNFQAGYAGVLALQLRVAITDKLAFIATKDGFLMHRPDTKVSDIGVIPGTNPRAAVLRDENAFLNATIGFKYALIEDPENNFILSPALRYEIPMGQDEVFQGRGDGVFIPSATFAWAPVSGLHLIGGLGGQIPVDTTKESTSLFYNMHVQVTLFDRIVPFIELSGITWTNSGNGKMSLNTSKALGADVTLSQAQAALGASRFEGADVFNLGSRGIAGESLITTAWGLRIPLDDHVVLGVSYERALHGDKNLFDQRVTAMATYEY